jgi:hypothetical protein
LDTCFNDPRERNSKTLTYHQWCALPSSDQITVT